MIELLNLNDQNFQSRLHLKMTFTHEKWNLNYQTIKNDSNCEHFNQEQFHFDFDYVNYDSIILPITFILLQKTH